MLRKYYKISFKYLNNLVQVKQFSKSSQGITLRCIQSTPARAYDENLDEDILQQYPKSTEKQLNLHKFYFPQKYETNIHNNYLFNTLQPEIIQNGKRMDIFQQKTHTQQSPTKTHRFYSRRSQDMNSSPENYRASKNQADGLYKNTYTLQFRMEGLTEVNQLDVQLTVSHYVCGLEVQVYNFILSQIPQALCYHDAEIYLCVHRHSLFVFYTVSIQIRILYVVQKQIVLVLFIFFSKYIILWKKHGNPVFYFSQDHLFVGNSASPTLCQISLILSLNDYTFLMGRIIGYRLYIWQHSQAVRSHIPVLNLSQIDISKATRIYFFDRARREFLVDFDIVQDIKILVRIMRFLYVRQLDLCFNILPQKTIDLCTLHYISEQDLFLKVNIKLNRVYLLLVSDIIFSKCIYGLILFQYQIIKRFLLFCRLRLHTQENIHYFKVVILLIKIFAVGPRLMGIFYQRLTAITHINDDIERLKEYFDGITKIFHKILKNLSHLLKVISIKDIISRYLKLNFAGEKINGNLKLAHQLITPATIEIFAYDFFALSAIYLNKIAILIKQLQTKSQLQSFIVNENKKQS